MSLELHPVSWYRAEFLSYLQDRWSGAEIRALPLDHVLMYSNLFTCICQGYNTTSTCYRERGVPQGSELAFLLLWPTGLRILPFKVRPLSVSLYPHVSLILLSLGGSPGAPASPFFFCCCLFYKFATSQSCSHICRRFPSRFLFWGP